ncbi:MULTISPECIES: TetR family transcriptional regulator [unclassified Streptomyces]|uniref:TetR/AcrR family transcriptional regulator n=1 Tax=unclassified Streptomyces TaxID=2593676 RepID=UPI002E81CEDB|nr:TetR family transcriptional regulator [Streptomyces sp. NBC_00589]WTI35016.1 TetR family transcriptional regulator [Streptomyces sp. NBC_00775]WUB31310.1 TetR family transcriptional regulator [Streptomyces sp. NBC_00589]
MSTGNGIPCATQADAQPGAATRRGRSPSRGGGRRPGQSSTKEQILTAALELFAAKGYSGTTMRGIAQQAQVDPALIHHFFSNKEGVFQDAVSSRLDVSALFDSLTEDDAEPVLERRGERVARTFLSFWEDESTRPALIAIYRTGLSDEATSKTFRDQIEDSFADCVRRLVPGESDHTPAFASLVSAQLAGLVMLRYVLRMEPLASLDFEELIEWFVPALEVHFDRLSQS